MGALTVIEFVTLDGVMQGLHHADERDGFRHSGWGVEFQDPAQVEKATKGLPATGSYLFGRRTYEEMASFWPFQPDENRMAAHLNRSPKYVVTHRDDELRWANTRRLDGDLTPAVTRLKAEGPGDVAVLGSGELVAQLLDAGLVDRFHLYVHPLVLGSGHTLFPRTETPLRLQLEDVDHSPATGVLELTYRCLPPR